jgi:hypothetical protein
MFEPIRPLLLIVGLALLSGLCDSYGFTHAANVWQGGKLVGREVTQSAGGFLMGSLFYWFAVRYLNEVGVIAAELQTLLWLGTTLIGVALLSGRFLHWRTLDQLVAVIVLAGIGWLLSRTGG